MDGDELVVGAGNCLLPYHAGRYKASITKNGVTASVVYTIEKADQPAPSKPEYDTNHDGDGSVVSVKPVGSSPIQAQDSTYTSYPEYRIVYYVDGAEITTGWEKGTEFVLDKALTNYYIQVRYSECDNYNASPEAVADSVYFFAGDVEFVVKCGEGVVYTTPKYGFLCMPRIITERLVEKGHKFGEADAWLDLWCHTVYRDKGNAFSFLAPAIQYGKFGSVLTLETLGKRWKWEKTKVWRFFQFYCAYFPLHRLPGSFGCVIYNRCYPTQDECDDPSDEEVMRILELIRIKARNTHTEGTDNERINRFVAWKSRKVIQKLEDDYTQAEIQNESEKSSDFRDVENSRVAEIPPIIRAYFSHGRNCKYSRNCIYDCSSIDIGETESLENWDIGAVRPFDRFAFFNLDTS